MGVERPGGVLLGHVLALRVDREPVEQLDGAAVTLLGRRLDRGLEALAQDEHECRVVDRVTLVGCEIEVVGLGPGRSQIVDLHEVPAHPLRRVGDGVEGRDDGDALLRRGRRRRNAREAHRGTERECHDPGPWNSAIGRTLLGMRTSPNIHRTGVEWAVRATLTPVARGVGDQGVRP